MLEGNDILGTDHERGMVFQSYTSFDWLTVQQNVEYGMKLNGVSRAERQDRADHFIDLVNYQGSDTSTRNSFQVA